jgi:hypothetical protein
MSQVFVKMTPNGTHFTEDTTLYSENTLVLNCLTLCYILMPHIVLLIPTSTTLNLCCFSKYKAWRPANLCTYFSCCPGYTLPSYPSGECSLTFQDPTNMMPLLKAFPNSTREKQALWLLCSYSTLTFTALELITMPRVSKYLVNI